jgi:hypothetical protein
MQTFTRSPYPPGYGGHQPGIRDKFGFGSPGPELDIGLTRPESCPGLMSLKQTQGEDGLDSLWPPTSPFGSKSGQGSARDFKDGLVNSPAVKRKSKIAALASKGIVGHLEDEQGTKYFVPATMAGWPKERVVGKMKSLSKLEKQFPPITPGMNGQGTGFNAQKPGVNWWPPNEMPDLRQRSIYRAAFQDKPYHPKSGFYLEPR